MEPGTSFTELLMTDLDNVDNRDNRDNRDNVDNRNNRDNVDNRNNSTRDVQEAPANQAKQPADPRAGSALDDDIAQLRRRVSDIRVEILHAETIHAVETANEIDWKELDSDAYQVRSFRRRSMLRHNSYVTTVSAIASLPAKDGIYGVSKAHISPMSGPKFNTYSLLPSFDGEILGIGPYVHSVEWFKEVRITGSKGIALHLIGEEGGADGRLVAGHARVFADVVQLRLQPVAKIHFGVNQYDKVTYDAALHGGLLVVAFIHPSVDEYLRLDCTLALLNDILGVTNTPLCE